MGFHSEPRCCPTLPRRKLNRRSNAPKMNARGFASYRGQHVTPSIASPSWSAILLCAAAALAALPRAGTAAFATPFLRRVARSGPFVRPLSAVPFLKIASNLCLHDPFSDPRGGLGLYPVQRFKAGFEFVDLLNCAIGPFGLDLPVLAFPQHHAKNRFSRRHVHSCTR